MKRNKLRLVLLGMIVVAAGIAGFQAWTNQPSHQGRTGQNLLPDMDLSKAAQIRIQSYEGVVTMHSKDGQEWRVKEQEDFYADGKKIKESLGKMLSTKLAHQVTSKAERMEGLGLLTLEENGNKAEDGKTGISLEIKDAAGEPLYAVIFGKIRSKEQNKGVGGQYIRYPDKNIAYLVNRPLIHDTRPQDWIDRIVINVNADEMIQSYRILKPGNAPVLLFRDKAKTPWKMEGTPDEQVNQQEASSIANLMAALDVYSVAPNSKTDVELGRARVGTVEMSFFDNRKFTLTIGDAKGGDEFRYITLEASFAQPVQDEELKEKVDRFNTRYASRTFGIYDWDGGRMLSDRKTFLPQED